METQYIFSQARASFSEIFKEQSIAQPMNCCCKVRHIFSEARVILHNGAHCSSARVLCCSMVRASVISSSSGTSDSHALLNLVGQFALHVVLQRLASNRRALFVVRYCFAEILARLVLQRLRSRKVVIFFAFRAGDGVVRSSGSESQANLSNSLICCSVNCCACCCECERVFLDTSIER